MMYMFTQVGYSIRFEDCTSERTVIKVRGYHTLSLSLSFLVYD